MLSKKGLMAIEKNNIKASSLKNGTPRLLVKASDFNAMQKEIIDCWDMINFHKKEAISIREELSFIKEKLLKVSLKAGNIKKRSKER